jgi:hypothetical protein
MGDFTRKVCDCGRPATRKLGQALICEFCYQCEKKGCTGGPSVKLEKWSKRSQTRKSEEVTEAAETI